jgi:deoxyribonuclease I
MGVWRVVLGFCFFFSFAVSAAPNSNKDHYYGRDFLSSNQNRGAIKEDIHLIVSGYHSSQTGEFDEIAKQCTGKSCFKHTAIGYRRAREFLFGKFYLVKEGKGFGVKDVYCQKVREADEFEGEKPGPNQIPDHRVINAEHTWPQSMFTKSFSGEDQKSDLHHLFPTDSELNSKRSSWNFGEVNREVETLKCPQSKLGNDRNSGEMVFEPPQAHKGNVARALFYFAIRYKTSLNSNEEATLRKWHEEDPVDAEENLRNEEIFKLQYNRNPFVDYPELVNRVADF